MSWSRSSGVPARKPSSSMPARPIALRLFATALVPIPLRPITRSSHTQNGRPSRTTTCGPRSACARASRDSHRPGGTAWKIQVVVAGVEVGRRVHGAHGRLRRGAAMRSLIDRGGAPAVVPPSTGQHDAGDLRRPVARQVQDRVRDVTRRSRRAAAAASRGTISDWSSDALIAVGMCAGATQFTRTPCSASSIGDRSREVDDRGLRRAVRHHARRRR